MIKIRDVMFSEQFWSDWESVPATIQKRFNDDIEKMSLAREILPSVQAHKVKNHEGGWYIGYISKGVFAWRFLFSISSSGVMIVERILSHNEMDRYFK